MEIGRSRCAGAENVVGQADQVKFMVFSMAFSRILRAIVFKHGCKHA